ncbi:transposase [Bacillus sp. FJAT-27445]|uniref:transposase n=1 Tax=Bacillus sp. FJAT-27445 TaxID=1679166 RepID=UPI0020A401E3|nr:transposase [Bacillus sp. FJAT-27445]
MLRGANRQEIFHDEQDRLEFLRILKKYREQADMKVFAWCLMGTHVHLLLQEGTESLSQTMKRIAVSYALLYNWKYGTTGHLFENRFKSECVEMIPYLLTVVRYIHQNPVKAGIASRGEDWKWSSCRAYYDPVHHFRKWLDCGIVLGFFSGNPAIAQKEFKLFNEKFSDEQCLEETATVRRLPDEKARQEIKNLLGTIEIPQVKTLPKLQRDDLLRQIKTINGLTQRQAARILGISPNLIFRA